MKKKGPWTGARVALCGSCHFSHSEPVSLYSGRHRGSGAVPSVLDQSFPSARRAQAPQSSFAPAPDISRLSRIIDTTRLNTACKSLSSFSNRRDTQHARVATFSRRGSVDILCAHHWQGNWISPYASSFAWEQLEQYRTQDPGSILSPSSFPFPVSSRLDMHFV